MIKVIIPFLLFVAAFFHADAQKVQTFTKADSLRGSLNKYRTCYDVTFYDLNLRVVPDKKYIRGFTKIHYQVKASFQTIQVDLFDNLEIEDITYKGNTLFYDRIGNAIFIHFPEEQVAGTQGFITVAYHGKPVEAQKPPWDGGFVWSKDEQGTDWIGVACEGIGASLWWPNKDHLSEEPDSVSISCEVPASLMCVSNGQFRGSQKLEDGYTRYKWFVSYPINNYNVTLNIADYEHINDAYYSRDGDTLALDYYVLPYNKEKARAHFEQVKGMLACYEKLFGKYPFWRDGFKLVETPYWGMEHQSAVAYGNNYLNNEFDFDFIIIHESAHEYWGNSVSCNDHAELWIHESFTTYAEALYLECQQDYETAVGYMHTQKMRIANLLPILGPRGVNYDNWQDADMYFKGTWMLHSIRNTIANDSLWFGLIRGLYQQFKISNVSTEEVINYMNERTAYDLQPIFDQFLKESDAPRLLYKIEKEETGLVLKYKWQTAVEAFNMPVKVKQGEGPYLTLYPGPDWQTKTFTGNQEGDIVFSEELFYFLAEELE